MPFGLKKQGCRCKAVRHWIVTKCDNGRYYRRITVQSHDPAEFVWLATQPICKLC